MLFLKRLNRLNLENFHEILNRFFFAIYKFFDL